MLPDEYCSQAETWCSIPGLEEFGICCKRTGVDRVRHMQTAALARQVSVATNDTNLAQWAAAVCRALPVKTRQHEIYRSFILEDNPERFVEGDDEECHWLTAQLAERAWYRNDIQLLARYVNRLDRLPANPRSQVNHGVSLAIWASLLHHSLTGQFLTEPWQNVCAVLTGIERQGLVIHSWRLRNKIHLGRA